MASRNLLMQNYWLLFCVLETEPSDEDIKVTKQLRKAGEMMGIPIIDHVIVTKDKYYSFEQDNNFSEIRRAVRSLDEGL